MSITQEQANEVKEAVSKAWNKGHSLWKAIDSLVEKPAPAHYAGEPFNDELEFTGEYRLPDGKTELALHFNGAVVIYPESYINPGFGGGKRWILRKKRKPEPKRPAKFPDWSPENQKQYIETR
jgi:hypothetical protein